MPSRCRAPWNPAFRAALFAFVLTLPAWSPAAAAQANSLPPLGISVDGIAPLKAAGAPPRYASYWVGEWMAHSGWAGFEHALRQMRDAGVTPVIYWYYWGDSITPACVENGCNSRDRAEWASLTNGLADRIRTIMGGQTTLVVLENEFNKGGIPETWYAPTFDARLAGVQSTLKAVPGVKTIVGFGAWGESAWSRFPQTIAGADYVGFQLMRASTRDTETNYRGAADRAAALTHHVATEFNKPSFLYDVALSSYPDARWEAIQAETLDAIFRKLVTSGSTGLQGVVYRSLKDTYMDPSNYYGLAESHWGLQRSNGAPKPAYDVWLAAARGAPQTPPPPPPPPAANVPGTFEAEAMRATAGGRIASGSASGGAYWNLWSNGDLSTTLVANGSYEGRLTVVASGQPAAGVNPRMEIRLGSTLLGTHDVRPGFNEYAHDVIVPSGSTTLRLVYTNDAIVNGVDRNLLLDVTRISARPADQPPTADFTATADRLRVDLDASASVDPEGQPLTYAWALGDGTQKTGRIADHTYARGGDYEITLTVSDGKHSVSTKRNLTVARGNVAPDARISWSAQDLRASFDASGSSDADGDALTYAWSFGDGTAGAGINASHTYAKAGTYEVKLVVSDGLASSEATASLSVRPPNAAPTAAFAWSSNGLETVFDGRHSTDPDGDALTFAWDMGDGTRVEGASPIHRYSGAGSYLVRLTVRDPAGLASEATAVVNATAPPFAPRFSGFVGNEWWVQVDVAADAPVATVCAIVDGGACRPLAKQSWGSWAASFHVPRGSQLAFRATSTSGEAGESAAMAWPPGKPAPEVRFTPYEGNAYWVQTRVESDASVRSVCATLNGGLCRALTYRAWGAWAATMAAPAGTKVVFHATLADGAVVKSATYTWPVK